MKGEVQPLGVGTRGAVLKENIWALEKLKIRDKKSLLSVSLTVGLFICGLD
jgi:hypothetical protein